jgi:hypothetical protein
VASFFLYFFHLNKMPDGELMRDSGELRTNNESVQIKLPSTPSARHHYFKFDVFEHSRKKTKEKRIATTNPGSLTNDPLLSVTGSRLSSRQQRIRMSSDEPQTHKPFEHRSRSHESMVQLKNVRQIQLSLPHILRKESKAFGPSPSRVATQQLLSPSILPCSPSTPLSLLMKPKLTYKDVIQKEDEW